jgi:predicted MFS family arabinose efflux permease
MDRRLLILALGMFAMGTDNFVVAGILPSVASSLHTSVSVAGQMVTVYALTYAVMAPVLAALGGRWPRKTLLVSALGIFVVGNVISALAGSIDTVLISRAVAGFGAALFSPTALGVATSLAAPERRGRALATVTAGLAGATALGAPIGTLIGGIGDWRTTLWFVALLGAAAMAGVAMLLRALPQPAPITLRERLAPLREPGIVLTLLTSLFGFGGFLMVYSYAGLVFDRATGGQESLLAALLLVWGVAATLGNIVAGRLVDRFDSRSIINLGLLVGIADFCALHWSAAHLATTVVALVAWGLVGWGLIVPQQHRLVSFAPQSAPVLMALNNTATYLGLAASGVLGGASLLFIDRHDLGFVGAGLIALALVCAEGAQRFMLRRQGRRHALQPLATR